MYFVRIRDDSGTDNSVLESPETTIGLREEGARKTENLYTDCFYAGELLYC